MPQTFVQSAQCSKKGSVRVLNQSDTAAERGLLSMGDTSRGRRLVRELMAGTRHVTVVMLGGSITAGNGATPRNSWVDLTRELVRQAFPRANMTIVNGAAQGDTGWL